MLSIIRQTVNAWQKAWSDVYFRWQFIISFVLFWVVCLHNFHYLNIWEFRTGERLNDPLLKILRPYDFSNIIFFFTYSAIVLVILSALPHPGYFVRGLQVYALITLLRTSAIYFFPLEPPADMILLVDPVADFFMHQKTVITKDLFFSGHTATLTMMYLFAQNKYLKIYCLVALIVAPFLLIWQHVHYAIDIVVAPFVAYGCVKIIDWVNNNYEYGKVLFRH
jgi:hypothetical protein